MKCSVPALLVFATSLISMTSWGSGGLVSAENLSVGCSLYHNELLISQEHRSYEESTGTQKHSSLNLYKSSRYLSGSSCGQARFRVEALVNFAKLAEKKIKIEDSSDLSKAFQVVNEDGSVVRKISATGLEVSCRDMSLNGLDMRLVVKFQGTVIYATSRYTFPSGDSCFGDRAELERKINLANASGKLLNYQFGDSPGQDFNIAD